MSDADLRLALAPAGFFRRALGGAQSGPPTAPGTSRTWFKSMMSLSPRIAARTPPAPSPDAILLLSPRRANHTALQQALQPLIGKIDVTTMQEANLRAAGSASPDAVARWLWEQISKR
jgi:hypothetical protein